MVVVYAGVPIMKICRRGETPAATQEAVKMPLMAVEARAFPGQDDKKRVAPVAAKEVGKMPPMAAETGPPARNIYEKGEPPMTALMLLLLLGAGLPHCHLWSYVRRWRHPWPPRRQARCTLCW